MKKNLMFVAAGSVVAIVLLYFIFSPTASGDGVDIIVPVNKGKFSVEIATTGELKALRSVQILGPTRAREFRVNQLTIERMVDEGTVVKKGDFIASLDKSELFGKLSDGQNNLDSEIAQYEQAKLDTALSLRQERDNILNLEYNVEQKKLVLEQSQYEPPATIKQNEYDLEKAERDLDQAKQNYKIKYNQALAKMAERTARLRKEEREFQQMQDLLNEFTITAPQDGMVIFQTNWDGNKIGEGSQISAWNPVVATLPDLTEMQSITYVNEVEIRKVKVGQNVEIGLDAFPEKKFTGKVTRVANVGQQRPNSDAKVFEVTILVNESDPVMRPAMTTSNTIIAKELEETIFVPLEAIHVQNDSINYVYLNNGVKQEVKLGLANYDEVVVELGLNEGDKVYLSIPDWSEKDKNVKLLKGLDGTRNQKEEETVAEEPKRPERRQGRPGGGGPRPAGTSTKQ
ncbi:efflux RND transporter periplasmic adaptor subunit [Echinicola sp. CAU 1574]|uniref:Efflux RND transporter periplasmic adaptor subunit n=1 Tax=Echinicola arenosa TaxID=2774144 RepID=A0ABR9AMY6_9BACT|nr:efflux RND transporter periplasmic adaptor subunit [Echinicola arenosa]MBD8490147.1 efflux RND transporter periplasmic adaptor subunit [Echinicola arenosa]